MRKIIVLLLLFLPMSSAQDGGEFTIEQLRLAEYVTGDKILKSKLKNYIVLLHFWSTRSSESRGELSTLIRFYKKYKNYGVFIIGVHSQIKGQAPADRVAVWKFVKQSRIPYMIVMGATSPKPVEKVPHLFVFNAGGEVAYDEGPLAAGLQKVGELLKKYPQWLLGEREIKHLKREAREIVRAKKLGAIYKKLAKLKEKLEDEKKEEAEYLMQRLTIYAQEQKGEFFDLRHVEPLFFMEKAAEFIKRWKGHQEADAVQVELNNYKTDPNLKKLVEAAKLYEKMQVLYHNLKPVGEKPIDLSDSRLRSRNRSTLRQIFQICQVIAQRYPESPYVPYANQMMEQLK